MAPWPISWIDKTIPAELLAEPHQRSRARLVQTLFLLALFGLVVAGTARFANDRQILVSHTVPIAALIVCATLLRVTKSLTIASVAVLACGHLALVANAFELGGMVVVMTWGPVLVAGAVYIIGLKAGWIVGAATILSAMLLALAEKNGWLPSPLVEASPFEFAIMVTNQVVMMVVFVGFYSRETRSLNSSLEAARQEADASNLAKSIFLATMSHEIRTPMNGVIASADLLRRRELPEEERALAEIVFTSGEVLLSLLNDILDFSKFEAGEIELEAVPFSIADCTSAVMQLQTARAREKNIQLELAVDPQVPAHVVGDGSRLRQVLLNLVSNGLKFTAEGHVRVTVAPTESAIRFSVADTGIGITSEQMTRLFRPFSQADASVRRTHGGTGLGLAISQHLVRAMGGTITVQSTPDIGSVFSFDLQLSEASADLAPPPTVDATGDTLLLDGAVLVVDDNQINRRVLEKMLQKLGCATISVVHGEAALRALEQERIALVLMDRQMPILDGLETTRRIRALETATASTPIVGVTAFALSDEVAECIEAGMQDVVAKPLTFRALQDAVTRWARRQPEP